MMHMRAPSRTSDVAELTKGEGKRRCTKYKWCWLFWSTRLERV